MPWWTVVVILSLAAVEPLTHAWIAYAPPPGTVPTGAHTGDSAHHLICMRMCETSFFSPFATCRSPVGRHSFALFAPPIFLLYGTLGVFRRLLDADAFLFLGTANGAGGALYLTAAWFFMREAAPKYCNRAFLLFALGGGLGGALYVATAAAGVQTTPEFEEYFRRYAHYELIEGPHLSPALLMPRLYYTLPMACAFAGLGFFVRAVRRSSARWAVLAAGLLCAATFINIRIGPMAWVIGALYVACLPVRQACEYGEYMGKTPMLLARRLILDTPVRERTVYLVLSGAGVVFGAAPALYLLELSPAYTSNMLATVRMAMWLSPFVSATFFYWFLVPCETARALRGMPQPLRVPAFALAGYLMAFGVLYLGYQAYYGNIWHCLDVMVAIRMGDWALTGAFAGAVWAVAVRRPASTPITSNNAGLHWPVLWLLLFLAVALSAFGQGWFMRFNPQRCMIMLGLPIALLAARRLERLALRRKVAADCATGLIIICGVCSTTVAATCFQGPLGYRPGEGPFAYLHYETMTPADKRALEHIEPGATVVCPTWSPISFGDIVALRDGVSVVGGVGALNLAAQPFGALMTEIDRFFDPATSTAWRKSFVERWCVDYVYCPDTCPVDAGVVRQFRDTPWLELVYSEGDAFLFSVKNSNKAT